MPSWPLISTAWRRSLAPWNAGSESAPPCDVLVLGSGVAGLSAALAAHHAGCAVTVLAKGVLDETNTRYAQGGIAAVFDPSDSVQAHFDDTCEAGSGLCETSAVRFVIDRAPQALSRLIERGACFDGDGLRPALTQEGGHRARRILHADGDATGREIQRALMAAVAETEAITPAPRCFVIDLVTDAAGRVAGAWIEREGRRVLWRARAVVLATGGAGCLFRETTNPAVATGDGLALALRAGATLRDLEFVQFHPTTLYIAGLARILITEALRGEGAHLVNARGERFMRRHHPNAELAPRDVVSQAIVREMRRTQAPCVYLSLRHLDGRRVAERFPGITRACREFGLELARDLIPVVPTAHYFIGGVQATPEGVTEVPGMFACGEVAATGLHGANRLGSNSLLEGLVCGEAAGLSAACFARDHDLAAPSAPAEPDTPCAEEFDEADFERALRSTMTRFVGVEREAGGLNEALASLAFWQRYMLTHRFSTPRGFTLQNMVTLASLVAACAFVREESRGVHFRTDAPRRNDRDWQGCLSVSHRDGIVYHPRVEHDAPPG